MIKEAARGYSYSGVTLPIFEQKEGIDNQDSKNMFNLVFADGFDCSSTDAPDYIEVKKEGEKKKKRDRNYYCKIYCNVLNN